MAQNNIKKRVFEKAKHSFQDILQKFPENKKALLGISDLDGAPQVDSQRGSPLVTINQWTDL